MIRELFLSDFSLSSCVWQSTIFLVVGLVSSFILRHRSARAHQVLFLAMMAAVIVPIMSILVKHYELGMFVAEPVVIQSSAKDLATASDYGPPGVLLAENIEHKPGAIEEILPSAMAGSESAKFPWRSVVLYGWIAASLILAARLLVTFVLGVRLLGRALPLECQRIKEAAHLARMKLGIDKDVKVRSSRGVRSPVIWCWKRRPVLLVPSEAGRFDNGVDWAGVLCHELAHYKRRDHISGLFAELAVCILPWHPLLWWAKSRLVRLSEQVCDDWVVATGQPGTDYAESLLDLTPGGQMAFVPAVVSTKRGLADRVRRILKDKCGNPRTGALWALTVSIVAACLAVGVACAQTRPAKTETASERKEKPTKSLLEAATDGDIDQIRLYLSIGSAVNAKGKKGRTALHHAARKGHVEIARLLIAGGADVNIRAEGGQTPLHRAADRGRREMAELLILQGADVNAEDENGQTPLSRALHNKGGGREMVELLASKGATVPALHLAAHRGQLEKIRENLGDRANMDARDEGGRTLLHYAASAGQSQVVELLIARGADVDAKDKSGETPLYYAADAGWRNMAELLIADGADVNIQQVNRRTPLHEAAGEGSIDVAELLIAHGANPDAKDRKGYTPLHETAWWTDPSTLAVAKLLLDKGADVNARATWDGTPLTDAADSDNLPLVELLVDRGANVNATCPFGCTCLHHAVSSKSVAEFLITKGADVNAKDRNGQTPLHSAVREGSRDSVELLIAKGADVNATNKWGRTPLDIAIDNGHAEIVRLLLKHGAKSRNAGTTPLQQAAVVGDIEQVRLLIDKGADVNAKDKNGQTPLHIVCSRGNKDMAKLLIAKGADINAKSNTWYTSPLIAAIRNGHEDIAKLLIAEGADVNAIGRGDYTALHWAAMNRARMTGSTDIMKLLLARGADIEARQEHGATPLACAAFDGNTESANFLIEHGADIEAKLDDGETTPLFRAVRQQYVETAKLLLAKGADIHARWRRLTVIHVAMMGNSLSNRKSDKEIVKLLIEKGLKSPPIHLAAYFGDLQKLKDYLTDGIRINDKDAAAYTPLHCAVCGDHTNVVKFLLSKTADVNAKTTNGLTPLRFVWTVDMAALLIANGADVRIVDENGQTALHGAVNRNNHRGDKALIKLLLKQGADINAKAASTSVGWPGWTPFHVACRNGNKTIVEMLIAKGADINAKTDKDYTPLSLAKQKNHKQVVELLRKHGAKE